MEKEDTVGGRVRTETVDGYLVDRGFQLINPAYPALRAEVDLEALDLKPFGHGVQVSTQQGLQTLANPLRHPLLLPQTLASGLVDAGDVAGLIRFVASTPRGGAALGAELDRFGVTGAIRTKVLAPFLPGVVADDPDAVDAAIAAAMVQGVVDPLMCGIGGMAVTLRWTAASSRRSPSSALAHRCGKRSGSSLLPPRPAAARHDGDTRAPHRGQVIRQVWNQTRKTASGKPAPANARAQGSHR